MKQQQQRYRYEADVDFCAQTRKGRSLAKLGVLPTLAAALTRFFLGNYSEGGTFDLVPKQQHSSQSHLVIRTFIFRRRTYDETYIPTALPRPSLLRLFSLSRALFVSASLSFISLFFFLFRTFGSPPSRSMPDRKFASLLLHDRLGILLFSSMSLFFFSLGFDLT